MIWGIVVGAAVVLILAGIAKVAKPTVTLETLRGAGLPAPPGAVEALGVSELVVGAATLVWHPPLASAAVAVFYAGFALFSARLLAKRGRGVSCGCFGVRDAPIGAEHVVVNALVAAGAIAAAVGVGADTVHPGAAIVTAGVLVGVLAIVPAYRAGR